MDNEIFETMAEGNWFYAVCITFKGATMNILLTGATGFIGRNFIEVYLNNKGENDRLFAVAKKGTFYKNECLIEVPHVNHRIKCEHLEGNTIDVLVHLGGMVPTKSTGNPTYEEMVRFTDNIGATIDLIRELPNVPENIIFASSVMVYADTTENISESSPTNPTHLYGLGKLYLERLLTQYALDHDTKCQILRIGQVYGKGEESSLIIPTLIDSALNNEKFFIFSDGQERRSFINVRDVARMIWRAIFLEESNIINVASATSFSVKELADIIMKIENKQSLVQVENRKITTRNFVYSCDRMYELLGHEEELFENGIEEEYFYRKRL